MEEDQLRSGEVVLRTGEHETVLVPDRTRPRAWTLRVGRTEQSYVDLDDPLRLEFDYVQRIADVLDCLAAEGQRLTVVHVGGAALTLPRYVAATRPSSPQVVLEPDAELTELVRTHLPLPRRSGIKVRAQDGRGGVAALRDDYADVVVLDAFSGSRVPAELTTASFFADVRRVVGARGTLLVNLTDRGPFGYGRRVLAGVAPWVLRILLGEGEDEQSKPVGSQLKINFLLDRLPALRSGVDPQVAFAGTLHLAEDYRLLQAAYDEASAGRIPDPLPGEVYCHSLTDPSILGDRAGSAHTLTYFGLHTPAGLFDADPEAADIAAERALDSLNAVLAEPIEGCVAVDADGRPCVEVKIPQDVERDLAMPGGHIFHGDLEWPWAANRALLDTPARQWGVQTGHESVLLCGSGARRGGAVSGLGGHNAAQAVLADL